MSEEYAQQAGSGLAEAVAGAFDRSRQLFEKVVAGLADPGCDELTHAQLEDQITERSRELMRSLFQDHLDLTARIQRFGLYTTDESPWPRSRSTPASASTWPPRPDGIRAQCGMSGRRRDGELASVSEAVSQHDHAAPPGS